MTAAQSEQRTANRAKRTARNLLKKSCSLLALLCSLCAAASSSDALITAAQDAWAERDQEGRTLAAIALYQQALKADPAQKLLWIDLTRAMNRTVRHTPKGKGRKEWAQRARDAGHQAVLENPANANAYAYYAEALGQWAQAHRGLGSLKRVKQAVENLNRAIQLDPQHGYAHMLLASFYQKAPSGISVGDKKKALLHARKAVEVDPAHAINHLTLAKILLDHGRREEAVAELKKVVALTPPIDAVPETKSDQETANKMLKEFDHAN